MSSQALLLHPTMDAHQDPEIALTDLLLSHLQHLLSGIGAALEPKEQRCGVSEPPTLHLKAVSFKGRGTCTCRSIKPRSENRTRGKVSLIEAPRDCSCCPCTGGPVEYRVGAAEKTTRGWRCTLEKGLLGGTQP